MRADVDEIGRFFRAGVQQCFELALAMRVEIGVFGPYGRGLDDECFAIRVKLVGHACGFQSVIRMDLFTGEKTISILTDLGRRKAVTRRRIQPRSIMHNSGTKLVLALVGLALLLGVVSWWYRYEAAHRASQFWGATASRLIAESEGFEARWTDLAEDSQESSTEKILDLSKARGQAHLRHALLSDRNYVWGKPLDGETTDWRWTIRFFEGIAEAEVLFSRDLSVIGKRNADGDTVQAYSCQPMTESLEQYFQALGLIGKPAEAASTEQE